MPAVSMEQIQPVLDRIDTICRGLGSDWGDRMLKGALLELKVHFLQRNIADAICTDLDFILVRFANGDVTPAALIEIKKDGRPLPTWQDEVYRHIAASLKVPFYLLEATDWGIFHITETGTGPRLGPFTIDELGVWMRSLVNQTEFVMDDRKRPLAEVY